MVVFLHPQYEVDQSHSHAERVHTNHSQFASQQIIHEPEGVGN